MHHFHLQQSWQSNSRRSDSIEIYVTIVSSLKIHFMEKIAMKKQTSPIFSIITPTYNREALLKRALQSVIKQDFLNYEVIIVNDNSTEKYDDNFFINTDKVCYIKNIENVGQAEARNIAVRMAQGEYLVFLDDDDELGLSFLKNTYEFYNVNKVNVDFSWSSVEFVDYDDGNVSLRKHEWPNILRSEKYNAEKAMRIGLGYGFVIKKSIYEKLGGLNPEFKIAEDTEFFARLLANGYKPAEIKDTIIYYHNHHDGKLTKRDELLGGRKLECMKILDLYKDFFNEYFHCKSALYWYVEMLEQQMAENSAQTQEQ